MRYIPRPMSQWLTLTQSHVIDSITPETSFKSGGEFVLFVFSFVLLFVLQTVLLFALCVFVVFVLPHTITCFFQWVMFFFSPLMFFFLAKKFAMFFSARTL